MILQVGVGDRMRVRLAEGQPSNGWLDKEQVYDVLALEINDRQTKYRIYSSTEEYPALFPYGQFDIVEASVSDRWTICIKDSFVTLEPEAWSKVGFWEAFYDGDVKASEIFYAERALISDQNAREPGV